MGIQRNRLGHKFDGDIVAAACCSLSVNDVHGGINMLLMGCEFQLAALTTYYLLDKEDPRTAIVLRFLLMRLEGLGQYPLCNSVIEAFGQHLVSWRFPQKFFYVKKYT